MGTHFGGSRVPKPLPKSAKNCPETNQKSNQNFDRVFNRFVIDFSFIVQAFWATFRLRNRPKRGGHESHWGSLAKILRRTRPEVPHDPQNGPPRPPHELQMNIQGCSRSAKMVPPGTFWT